MKKLLIGLIVVVVLTVLYYLISPLWRTIKLAEPAPAPISNERDIQVATSTLTVLSGDFVSAVHDVSGRAMIVKTEKGDVLRFENFKTLNGPDLRIYLSVDRDAKDFVDLGEIRATEGNVNYDIPKGTDTAKYKYVLVWCRAFRVLFGYAALQ